MELQSDSQPPCLAYTTTSAQAGSAVGVEACYGYASENWTVEPNGTLQVSGLCLDTQGEATAASTPVVLAACNGSATQIWSPGAPSYSLVNDASGLCLTIPGSTSANGTQVQIAACPVKSKTNEQWRLPAF
jgi:hypothetical protein